MSDIETTTSATALLNEPVTTEQPTTTKRAPRRMPNLSEAAKLQKQLDAFKAAELKLKRQRADVTAKLKAAKPPARSKDSGNTWQIKLVAAANPTGKLDAIVKAAKPKLVKNANGILPSDATIGTIRTDFYHSMRVFKSLSKAQQDALLKAI